MRSSRWLLAPALALVLVGLPSAGAHADEPAPPAPGRLHRVDLPGADLERDLLAAPRRGRAALTALGSGLRTAAGRNDLSQARLTAILREDPTAWVSTTGRLFYADVDTHETHPVAADIPPATLPLASTFTLHSRPGSAHTMYLDFNGYTLAAGADWIGEGWKAGTFKGFSIDATYGTFSTAEQAYIQHVWRITAEKYAALDIDVTTQDPGAAALNRSGLGDPVYGNRVVFTDDPAAKPAAVCPAGCLGVGFLGSFDDPTDNRDLSEPAWVFTADLKDIPAYAANVAAHEAGHNLGLSHDGTTADGDNSYYEGYANWFPIMGAGINAVSQFSKGEYLDANETQDDFAVMAEHGVSERPDDWGDTGSPSALGEQAAYTVNGVIEDAADQDVFTLDRACTAPLRLSATGIGEGQALDIRLTLKDGDGNVLATQDPLSGQETDTFPYTPSGLDAAIEKSDATAGTYQVVVEGIGSGTAPTGYSDYGSVGQYRLRVTGCSGSAGQTPSAPQSPQVVAVARTTTANLSWGAPFTSGDSAVSGYRITGTPEGVIEVPATTTHRLLTGLVPGAHHVIHVTALNQYGESAFAATAVVMPTFAPTAAPGMTLSVVRNQLNVHWTEPANPGHADFTMWRLTIDGQNFDDYYGDHSGFAVNGFPNGTFTARLTLFTSADYGSVSGTTTRTFRVGATAPRIGKPSSGKKGGAKTATARWAAPASLGGYPITGYRAVAYKLNAKGKIVKGYATKRLGARARAFTGTLPAGRYKFRVVAYNALGETPISASSRIVTSR